MSSETSTLGFLGTLIARCDKQLSKLGAKGRIQETGRLISDLRAAVASFPADESVLIARLQGHRVTDFSMAHQDYELDFGAIQTDELVYLKADIEAAVASLALQPAAFRDDVIRFLEMITADAGNLEWRRRVGNELLAKLRSGASLALPHPQEQEPETTEIWNVMVGLPGNDLANLCWKRTSRNTIEIAAIEMHESSLAASPPAQDQEP